MNINIINGIQLPAFDVEMLALGKLIAVPFHNTLKEGKAFWLYPSLYLPSNFSLKEYYRPEYHKLAEKIIVKYETHPIHIKAWARCESQWYINLEQKSLLLKIAESTIWNFSTLEKIFEKQQVLKILFLRVYSLSHSCTVNVSSEPGAYYWSKPQDIITSANNKDTPVILDKNFNKRKHLLLSGKANPNKNIEDLVLAYESSLDKNIELKQIAHDIKQFLGWNSEQPTKHLNPDFAWINDIAALGDRSIEKEEKKSNHQAGTDFEDIARRSLEFLGFIVDEAYRGGAGGLDLFCSKPYPLVCECKSGKGIRSGTVEELLKLGGMHLGKAQLFSFVKLIIGPGKPSPDTIKAAKQWEISIINAMTLQKLVEFHKKHPGSINLLELKEYLNPGQIDDKIQEYLNKLEQDIKLRSHIIQLVKKYLENTDFDRASVDALHGFIAGASIKIKTQELHEILVELSSPLTGYLGRIKGDDWKRDRFYFLRDLPIDLLSS